MHHLPALPSPPVRPPKFTYRIYRANSPGRRPPSTPPGPRITSPRRFYLPTFLSLQARRAPGPRPHTLPVAHSTSFTDASGALLTITPPAIGRRIDKVEISSFSPCSDSCLAISRPMVRWGEAPHLPHSHISRVSILVRDGSRPALAQPQEAFNPDDDDFVLEKQQRS